MAQSDSRCSCLERQGIGSEPISTAGGTSVDGSGADIIIARMLCPQCETEWPCIITAAFEEVAG